jgi:hypothetical protein
MSESISLTDTSTGYGDGTAVSPEADTIRRSVLAARESIHESIWLFGLRRNAVSEVFEVAAKHSQAGWDGEGAEPVSAHAVNRAIAFIQALPRSVPVPEIAAEPDGSISLDWIDSRSRVLSISIGVSDRLAVAWLDGTNQGHAVERFDGERIPPLILERIRETMGNASVRAA